MAFITSLIRVLMRTGTLLAFPGSMCGALLAGLMYKKKAIESKLNKEDLLLYAVLIKLG